MLTEHDFWALNRSWETCGEGIDVAEGVRVIGIRRVGDDGGPEEWTVQTRRSPTWEWRNTYCPPSIIPERDSFAWDDALEAIQAAGRLIAHHGGTLLGSEALDIS